MTRTSWIGPALLIALLVAAIYVSLRGEVRTQARIAALEAAEPCAHVCEPAPTFLGCPLIERIIRLEQNQQFISDRLAALELHHEENPR